MNTKKIANKNCTLMVAHRGVSGIEPENTAASFIAAGNRSYYGIETDVWRTLDHKYICNHDGKTGRICETELVIEQSNFDDIRALKVKDKDGKTDRNELIIPTPYEYFKICAKYEKVAVCELKSDFTIDEIKEIIAIANEFDYLDHTCFIAFNIHNLELVKEVLPNQNCQFLCSEYKDEYPELLSSKGMDIDISYHALNEENIKALHDKGVKVNCWTVDDIEAAEKLISWGIDFITSNILE